MALLESLLVWKPLQVILKLARLKDHYLKAGGFLSMKSRYCEQHEVFVPVSEAQNCKCFRNKLSTRFNEVHYEGSPSSLDSKS
jgi:hypothetical protein